MADFTWLAPAGLWAAAFLPAILLLYFLKLKRRRVIIPSTLLWRRAVNDARANAPLQRLRTNLLLLLQLLLALLVALALGRPAFMGKGTAASATVIILDASASMAATDVGPSRFAKAQDIALARISELSGSGEAMVLIAGPRPRVAATFGQDKRRLRSAIKDAKPAAAPSDLGGAIKLALAASEGRSDRELVVISDGAFEPPQNLTLAGVPVSYEQVGEVGGNVGITALDMRVTAGGGRQGFFTVTNDSAEPQTVDVEIRKDDDLIDVRPVVLPANSEASEVFGLEPGEQGGILKVTVKPGGTLAADDNAYVALPARGDLTVALGGTHTFLLKRALEADERLEVTDIGVGGAGAASATHDILVFHGDAPSVIGPGRWLLIDPPNGAGLFHVGAAAENPGRVNVDDQHPLARHAELGQVHIGRMKETTVPAGAQIIAETENGGPLLFAFSTAGRRVVVWTGEIFASDLPLRPAFPILLANSVNWLCAGCGSGARVVKAGDVYRGEVPVGVKNVNVRTPGGTIVEASVAEGEYLFDSTEEIGVYYVMHGDDDTVQSRFAVNLLSRTESDTTPRTEIKIGTAATGGGVVSSTGDDGRRRRSLWRPLVIFAAVLLTIEWLAWVLREGLGRRKKKRAEKVATA